MPEPNRELERKKPSIFDRLKKKTKPVARNEELKAIEPVKIKEGESAVISLSKTNNDIRKKAKLEAEETAEKGDEEPSGENQNEKEKIVFTASHPA